MAELVEMHVTRTVRRLGGTKIREADARNRAASLVRQIQPAPPHLLRRVLAGLLARLATAAAAGGWGPGDLRELIGRCAGDGQLPTLAAVLADDLTRLRFEDVDGLASALTVAALLASAPRLEAGDLAGGAADPGAASGDHPKLAQVRALLAKAESTDYDEEAEALSAKAQQLIAKYALGRLLDEGDGDPARPGSAPRVRRLWLDAPYVGAKATLVHEVAGANRCRAASAERFGFCVLVGASTDLDAVELLVTSLLVQADTALLRQGRRVTVDGRSRTRSFRSSFLTSYAVRIGERLRAATDEAVSANGHEDLLPVLHDHVARVEAVFEESMPYLRQRTTTVSDPEGWVAGAAAADLALLDVNGKLSERAG